MGATHSDLLAVLLGEANPELEAKVLGEVLDPASQVCAWVRGIEMWAKKGLSPLGSSAAEPKIALSAGDEDVVAYRIIRKVAFAESGGRASAQATVEDLLQYCNGTATDETSARVKQALEDPSSSLSLMLQRYSKGQEELD